jgi:hypothetical protein
LIEIQANQTSYDRETRKKKHILRFSLRFEEHSLTPAAILRPRARIRDAPSRTYHLKGQVARRATARPPPAVVWEERKRDDPPVLVALEELAFESSAVDLLFEPCECFIGVRLCWLAEMRTLWGQLSGVVEGRRREGLTSGASTPTMRMWIVFLTNSNVGLG